MTIDDATLREKVRAQYGDGIPQTGTHRPGDAPPTPRAPDPAVAAKRSAAGKKRQATGKHFEAELDDTHAGLARDGFGYIVPHYPPTVQAGRNRILRKGGGPCDYSGHVNVSPLNGALVSARDEHGMRSARRVPVVFDAKVLDGDHASYTHKPERIAQITHLLTAARSGACAFLLIRVDALGRVFYLSAWDHADALLQSRPIPLYESTRTGTREETRLGRTRAVPVYTARPFFPSAPYQLGTGWLWPSILPVSSWRLT